MINDPSGIQTYPVGLFSDWRRKRLRAGLRYLRHQYVAGNHRAIRNYFNGYLAEWDYRPAGVAGTKCGKGWTRRRALRSLGQRIVAANLHEREVAR